MQPVDIEASCIDLSDGFKSMGMEKFYVELFKNDFDFFFLESVEYFPSMYVYGNERVKFLFFK